MNRFAPLGGRVTPQGAEFLLWAPAAERVEVDIDGHRLPMQRLDRGYYAAQVPGVKADARYRYALHRAGKDAILRPDPASRHQPEGPHGASQLVDPAFAWNDDAWRGLPVSQLVIYELHVGAFTRGGTFDAVVEHLGYLRDLGVTAIELMPIAQFPGGRNWGYDGVGLFAAQNTYGGPQGLKRLVNACHQRGIAVVLDVVYNHLGPEGNYLADFGPYFTERYHTPWGGALNFDGEGSDEVRRYFIENALYWITDCHIDALRLDAVHAIVDPSPIPFVQELAAAVHQRAAELGRQVQVIAESAANDARVISPAGANTGEAAVGGIGCDAQWNDDFHHSLRALLTGDLAGYYSSFGSVEHLARAFRHGYTYTGEWSEFHQRRHGSPTAGLPGSRFVVFAHNHDQVGNRMNGERLGDLVSFEHLKLAAASVLLSPFVPLLFMGEEYGETAPFLYFISHSDPQLVEAVRRGRKEEFAAFKWAGEPPDPQAQETFQRCILDHALRRSGRHAALLEFYRTLLRLRREIPALAALDKEALDAAVDEQAHTLRVHRWLRPTPLAADSQVMLLFNFGDREATFALPSGEWQPILDSRDERFGGPGAAPERMKVKGPSSLPRPPVSFALLIRSEAAALEMP